MTDAAAGPLRLPQPFEELDHTADLGVRVRGPGPDDTLSRLVCVFGRLLSGTDDLWPDHHEVIGVEGGDLSLAATDILRELLYHFSTRRLMPATCRVLRRDDSRVEVEVGLAPYDATRHQDGTDIKAITLHEARFEPDVDAGGWLAQVVFDV